jgi:flagellar basal body-associated protein FliL
MRKRLEMILYFIVIVIVIMSANYAAMVMVNNRHFLNYPTLGADKNDASQEKEKSSESNGSGYPVGDRSVVYPGEQ